MGARPLIVGYENQLVEFLEQNKGGNLAAWTRTSVWSRDTGGERDRSGAPKRAQVPADIATIHLLLQRQFHWLFFVVCNKVLDQHLNI